MSAPVAFENFQEYQAYVAREWDKLTAERDQFRARVAELEAHVESLQSRVHLCTGYDALQARVVELEAGLECVKDLISNSEGVAGLHMNGDIAPWDELRTGGRFEQWLSSFDTALDIEQ